MYPKTANRVHVMGDMAMRAMASALRTLYRSKVPKRYSREMAARELGVSVRQYL